MTVRYSVIFFNILIRQLILLRLTFSLLLLLFSHPYPVLIYNIFPQLIYINLKKA